MEALIVYLLKSALSLGLLYAFYHYLLSKETFHHQNRTVLISVMLLSMILPSLEIENNDSNIVQKTFYTAEVVWMHRIPQVGFPEEPPAPTLRLSEILFFIYCIGIIWRLGFLIQSVTYIRRLFRKGYEIKGNDYRLIVGGSESDSFSFGRTVYLSAMDYAENFDCIWAHERAHIDRRHTIDLVIAELIITLQWFNPIVYFIKKDLIDLHEYEADRSVIEGGHDVVAYQKLLVKKAVGTSSYALASSLHQSSIKKRITMMLKTKSSRRASLKLVGIIPTAFICVSLVAKPIENAVSKADLTVKLANPTTKVVEKVEKPQKTFRLSSTSTFAKSGKKNAKHISYNLAAKEKTQVDKRVPIVVYIGKSTVTKSKQSGDSKYSGTIYTAAKKPTANSKQNDTSKSQGVTFAYAKSQSVNNNAPSNPDDVYNIVSNPPQYPGGFEALSEFLSKEISYPADAREKGIEGKVLVQFIVDQEGSLSNIKVIKGVYPSLDAEAVRVVKKMGKWTPGEHKGKKMKVQFVLPVVFSIK